MDVNHPRLPTPLNLKPREALPTVASIALRKDVLETFCHAAEIASDKELATRMHVDPATVHRVVRGDTAPGQKFIAGVLDVFGTEHFAALFQVISHNDKSDAA